MTGSASPAAGGHPLPAGDGADNLAQAVASIWRIEAPRVVAHLARLSGDLGLAEDCAQDAIVAALERWRAQGIPDRPGAWLMTVAKRRWLDRRRRLAKEDLREDPPPDRGTPGIEDEALSGGWNDGDERAGLLFASCHPVLPREAQCALTLKWVLGLTVEEIARAYLAAPATIAQRIVRAKKTLAAASVSFALPAPDERSARLATVLTVLYLLFNEGYAASGGSEWTRPALCEDALRLVRMLSHLMPEEADVWELASLMEFQASRLRARRDASGRPVLLADQDRGMWDRLLISRGAAALQRAQAAGRPLGLYGIQAAIAACHAGAPSFDATPWPAILRLYDALLAASPSPVVRVNRAVAEGMVHGPRAALAGIEDLERNPAVRRYAPYHAVRAELLRRAGDEGQARQSYLEASRLSDNAAEREILLRAACLDRHAH